MKNLSRLIFLLLAVMVIGGGAFLVTWDIPVPQRDVERVLPDDRFPR